MLTNPYLYCPVRGALNVKLKAKDGFTFTEEKRRIDCIHALLKRGYPASHIEAESIIIRFGHGGKNSLRADVVVYDQPLSVVSSLTIDDRRAHMIIIAEVKRDNANYASAVNDQLLPALTLLPSLSSLGLYWDDVVQSVFFKEASGGKVVTKEAAIATLPAFGAQVEIKSILYSDLLPANDLVKTFAALDDVLHQAGHAKDDRYNILFQVLLIKVFDEQRAKPQNREMIIQDFSVSSLSATAIKARFEHGLDSSLTVYGPSLPKKPKKTIEASGDTLAQISKTLCSLNLLGSSPQVIQDFFMYFGRFIYKVDLAQYFTPYEVIDC